MEWIDIDESLEEIQESVYSRLKAWKRKAAFSEDIMRYSQTVVRQFGECDTEAVIENGWQCGLGQMLNLEKEIICQAVPYMLTAYMYNYGRANVIFVKDFVKGRIERDPKTDFTQDELFGIRKLEENIQQSGIGELLRKKYSAEGGSRKSTLEKLSNQFVFSGVKLQPGMGRKDLESPLPLEKYILIEGYGEKQDLKAIQCNNHLINIIDKDEEDTPPIKERRESAILQVSADYSIDSIAIAALKKDLILLEKEMEQQEGEEANRRQKKLFRELYTEFLDLKKNIDSLKASIDELGKVFDKHAGKYSLPDLTPQRAQHKAFSHEIRYECFLNIFATWYHLWKEAEKSADMPWHPAYKVDPVLCVLLLKRTLYPKEEFAGFEEMIKESGEEAYECVDQIIEGQLGNGMFANSPLSALLEKH